MSIENLSPQHLQPMIKVFGIGNAGIYLAQQLSPKFPRFLFSALDSDIKTLETVSFGEKHLIGERELKGWGTGGDSDLAYRLASQQKEELEFACEKLDFAILLAGLGGGIANGLSLFLAEELRKQSIFTIAFFSLPFSLEGKIRYKVAEETLEKLYQSFNAVITIPKDLLLQQIMPQQSAYDAISSSNQWILEGFASLHRILSEKGILQVDWNSLKTIFKSRGNRTLFAIAHRQESKKDLLKSLLQCPLLYVPHAASRVDKLLIEIHADKTLPMAQIHEITNEIKQEFCPDGEIFLGLQLEESSKSFLSVTLMGSCESKQRRAEFSQTSLSQLDFSTEKNFNHEKKINSRASNESSCEFENLDVPTYLRRGISLQSQENAL